MYGQCPRWEPAEQAEPAEAKPAEAEDDKPAVAEDKPADDNAEPAVAEDAKPAEEGDDKPAEQAEDEAEPAVAEPPAPEEGEDDQPAAVAEAADAPAPAEPSDSGPVQGLRTTDKGDGWHELLARTLEEYTADLEIIKRSRERRHYRPCRRPLVADEVDPGDLLHQQPAEAGPEEREALGAAKGCFSPGARGLADFACFVTAVFVQGDTHRSGRPPGVSIPLKSLWADSPGVQRAPKRGLGCEALKPR